MENQTPSDQSDSNVTPEEQTQYDLFVSQCTKLIYGKGSGDAIEQAIKQADDVVDVLANTAAKTIISVEKSAQAAGKKIADDVVLHGGTEVVEQLIDYAEAMGKIKPEDKSKVADDVVFQTVRIYGEQALAEGLITPQEKEQTLQTLQEGMASEVQS